MRLVSRATGMNSLRHHETPGRVMPADQGLHADYPAASHRDLRLVVQDELLVLDRMAQVAHQSEVRRGARVH